MSEEVVKSFEIIRQELINDPEYAWSWHCNIAMCSYDEGLSLLKANKAAVRFMKVLFGIDTSKNEHYKKQFPKG